MINSVFVETSQQLNIALKEHRVDLLRDVFIVEDVLNFVFFSSEFYKFLRVQIKYVNTELILIVTSKWRNANYLIQSAINRKESYSFRDFNAVESIEKYKFKTVVDADKIEQDWYDLPPNENPFDHKTRWILLLKENIIQKLVTEVGYNSRHLEFAWKWNSFYQLQARLHQISPRVGFEFAELLTYEMEKLAQVELGDYTQALRMVYLELIRMNNHLKYLYGLMLDLNDPHDVPIKHLIESLNRLMIKINGQHGLNYTLMFGVVGHKTPVGWFNQCFELARKIEGFFVQMKDTFSSHFQKFSLLNSGHISYEKILHGGFSGPNLRAAGINWDLRLSHHRYFYDELDFHSAIGIKSTSFDRLMVRIQEIIYSAQLIEQLTDNMPELGVKDFDFKVATENNIWHRLVEQKFSDHQQLHFTGEGSQGEMHIFLTLNLAEKKIQIDRLSTSSFMNFSLIEEIACQQDFEEFQFCFKSLGLSAWERDL